MILPNHGSFNPRKFDDLAGVLALACKTIDNSTEPDADSNSLIAQLSYALAGAIYYLDELQDRVSELESNL